MNIKNIGMTLLAGLVIAGCAKKEEEAKPALSVNGVTLTCNAVESDVDAVMKAQGDKIPAEQKEYIRQNIKNQIVQSFIVENVLAAKAKAEGFAVTDAERKAKETEFLKASAGRPDAPKSLDEAFAQFPLGADRARAEFEKGLLIDKMIKAEQAKQAKVDYAAKAKEIIAGIVSNNANSAAADAEALKKAKGLKAELDAIKDIVAKTNRFAALAKAHSGCPSSAKGGDLGPFQHGQMVKEFDEVAFKQGVNVVSEPVKTRFGYHLILTTEKNAAVEAKGDAPAKPETVRASHILVKTPEKQKVPEFKEVVTFLQKQDEQKFVRTFVMNLVKQAKIEALDESYKQFVPPADDAKGEVPVEKPAAK